MKTIGLALGSGGARGWAHIGVLKALQEEGIEVDVISGASIGALVGAMHCAGELDELEDFIRDLSWQALLSYFNIVIPTNGLLNGNGVYELLSERLQEMQIEDSNIRFCCVATDLIKGEEIHLKTGSMVDAVRASISVPGIFTPFTLGGRCLVDGGLVNPVPVDVARSLGAQVVIAVNLNHRGQSSDPKQASGHQETIDTGELRNETSVTARSEASKRRKETFMKTLRDRCQALQDNLQESVCDNAENSPHESNHCRNIFDVIGLSLSVMEQQISFRRLEEHRPDLLVQPDVEEFAVFDFHKADLIIRSGYIAMKQQLPILKQLL